MAGSACCAAPGVHADVSRGQFRAHSSQSVPSSKPCCVTPLLLLSPQMLAGPMDTSSVNDPSGRAEGSYQQQQSPDSHSMHVHHPGREADAANTSGHSGGSGNGGNVQSNVDQDSFTAGSGGSTAARIDQPGSGPSGEGDAPRNLNAGVETTNVIPGEVCVQYAKLARVGPSCCAGQAARVG